MHQAICFFFSFRFLLLLSISFFRRIENNSASTRSFYCHCIIVFFGVAGGGLHEATDPQPQKEQQ